MKTFRQSTLLLTGLLLLAVTSCKKTENDPKMSPAVKAEEADLNTIYKQCLVTHTEDDLFAYTVDIFYNKAGDPDSMSFYGNFPVTMQYDQKGRLIRSNYGTAGVHSGYVYKDDGLLPAVINDYFPSFGGLIAVFTADYDKKGQIIKFGINNLLLPQYTGAEKFEYDNEDNVTRVTYTFKDGSSSYVENEAYQYDHKPAFMGGNKWLKFILLNSGVDGEDYFRMYSKNNPLKWKWGYPDGSFNLVTATYEYDHRGFATKANFSLLDADGITDVLDFTELSGSTCDEGVFKPHPQVLKTKPPILSEKKTSHLPLTLPAY